MPWLAAAEDRFFVAETDAGDISTCLFLQQANKLSAQFIEGASWFKIKKKSTRPMANFTTNVRNIFKEDLARIVTPLRAGHQGALAKRLCQYHPRHRQLRTRVSGRRRRQ